MEGDQVFQAGDPLVGGPPSQELPPLPVWDTLSQSLPLSGGKLALWDGKPKDKPTDHCPPPGAVVRPHPRVGTECQPGVRVSLEQMQD